MGGAIDTLCFTSFSFAYLARARVLAETVKRHNPHFFLVALVTDLLPPGLTFPAPDDRFDAIVYASDLGIPAFSSWIFQHSIVEAATAVKGVFLDHALNRGINGSRPRKVIYLDPDIAVFGSLSLISDALSSRAGDRKSIALTPHQLEPEEYLGAVIDNEIGSLAHGIFNLGFLAVRNDNEGRRFARWWHERLHAFCHDDVQRGIFTDQRWCDLVPAFFKGLAVLRDPGLNVASWNLSHRRITITMQGRILVNGSPLKFYHFTKHGGVGDMMTRRYARDNTEVYELWRWYELALARNADPAVPEKYWHYGAYSNGAPIERRHRLLFRNRSDLQKAFPDPFLADGEATFHNWLRTKNLA